MPRGRPFHQMAGVNDSALSFPSAAHRQTARHRINSLGPSSSPLTPPLLEHGAAYTRGGRGRGKEHGEEVANDVRTARRGVSAVTPVAVDQWSPTQMGKERRETRVAAAEELVPRIAGSWMCPCGGAHANVVHELTLAASRASSTKLGGSSTQIQKYFD